MIVIGIVIFSLGYFGIKYNNELDAGTERQRIRTYTSKIDKLLYRSCTKPTSYKLHPKLKSSVDLIIVRTEGMNYFKNYRRQLLGMYNCLDIRYAKSRKELAGAEGIFYFNPKVSSNSRLKILISPDYKIDDIYLNSFILAHELTHAIQFVNSQVSLEIASTCTAEVSETWCSTLINELSLLQDSCVELEATAFHNQIVFLGTLTTQEKEYLAGRIVSSNFIESDVLVDRMQTIFWSGGDYVQICGNSNSCMLKKWKRFVASIPAYQKQCNL